MSKMWKQTHYIELLNTCNIMFLQETWLFNFQTPLLDKYFTSHCSMGKAVDDDDPILPRRNLEDKEGWHV